MPHSSAKKIIVALSGGVDSAVAALLLKRSGHAVEGLHMTNWEDDDGYCTAARDYQDARQVCAELDIPLHHVNFAAEYRAQVFADFLREYAAGRTPNPDVLCNREIKFGACLDYARRLGADAVATGHYARTKDGRLFRAADESKDQSYFLHAVSRDALRHALFPLGEMRKDEVRRLATDAGLPVYDKRDSTGICFIGERPFREFLGQYLPQEPGDIEASDGTFVGRHVGLAFYTLGQRQGIGIGGRRDRDGDPWYVAGKDPERNVLLVAQGRGHPALWASGLVTERPHWIAGAPREPRCTLKTRYRQDDVDGLLAVHDDALEVTFDAPQWAVTPGQFAVFYAGDECLGGAVIAQAHGGAATRLTASRSVTA